MGVKWKGASFIGLKCQDVGGQSGSQKVTGKKRGKKESFCLGIKVALTLFFNVFSCLSF